VSVAGRRISVGNLPWTATEAELRVLFAPHGEVVDAKVIVDHETGLSRGYGFVSLATPDQAACALAGPPAVPRPHG